CNHTVTFDHQNSHDDTPSPVRSISEGVCDARSWRPLPNLPDFRLPTTIPAPTLELVEKG
ncbi:MAG: hypothetical protein M3083_19270, partial [Actinomycetota bacterium]|nr:hypothetical protein [Actinomycetota bacterium]